MDFALIENILKSDFTFFFIAIILFTIQFNQNKKIIEEYKKQIENSYKRELEYLKIIQDQNKKIIEGLEIIKNE